MQQSKNEEHKDVMAQTAEQKKKTKSAKPQVARIPPPQVEENEEVTEEEVVTHLGGT